MENQSMKPNRRDFLRLVGISAGAAVAAPVLARMPEPAPPIEALAKVYHEQVEKDLTDRLKSGQLSEDYHPHGNPHFVSRAHLGML